MQDDYPLLHEVKACRLCLHSLPHEPRPVLQWHPSAKILLAGQAPGRKVHESGQPFTDASGERLRGWLGIGVEDFYDAQKLAIVPMGLCYPGTGKAGDLPPRSECAPQWRERLLAPLINVRLTLLIGQYAQAYHLPGGKQSVTDAVGNWRAYWPGMVPLPHPSPRNNRWLKQNPWFEAELLPVLRAQISHVLAGF
ncbi:MAG: IclR family transcriptional regulator [Methylobacter sp.]|nr:MAG: IclR family transcriptional regulator [Methylobacter sp.]